MKIFKNGINVKWLAIFFIGIVLGIGITSAYPTIGDPDIYLGFIHGDCGNCSNLPAAQIVGNFTQRVNFSNTIYATGLTTTVPNDAAICGDPTTKELTINTGITDCSASSEIFKENIQTLDKTKIEKISNLHPTTYNYKGEQKQKIGLIAEEVAPVFPECIGYGDKGEIRGINYNCIVPVLIGSIQSQQNIIITQQNEVNILKYEIELLKGNTNAVAPTPIPIATEPTAWYEFWK